jgi:hypothetical protein
MIDPVKTHDVFFMVYLITPSVAQNIASKGRMSNE